MKNFHKTILLCVTCLVAVGLIFYSDNFINNQSIKLKPSPGATQSPLYDNFHLLIPSLDINAPVIANVDGSDKKAYDKALEGGVAQLQGSSKPGEGSNIFIFGHSSFYWWSLGNYKKIFANLDKLKEGDEITLWYNKKEYKYEVTETKIVSPDEVDVLKPTEKEQVSLMTCWPPNTTLKRLIVIAKRT